MSGAQKKAVCVCVCVCVYLSMCVWVGVGGWPLADHSDVAAEHCTRSPCMMAAARTAWRAHQKNWNVFILHECLLGRGFVRADTEGLLPRGQLFQRIRSSFCPPFLCQLAVKTHSTGFIVRLLDLSGHFPKIKNK